MSMYSILEITAWFVNGQGVDFELMVIRIRFDGFGL